MKIDLGCGPNKKEGFQGVDQYSFDGKVDIVADLTEKWPFQDGEVEEAHASHFLEHLTAPERCHFANELWRVLKIGGTAQVIVPHWASCRAYGDPTHQWPPVSEFWFYYLNREWRMQNAPHSDKSIWDKGFDCNLEATWGYSLRPDLLVRNAEFQQFAIQNYKEVCTDIIATLTKVA